MVANRTCGNRGLDWSRPARPGARRQLGPWPYTLLGVAFALYGIALFGYGNLRGTAVTRDVSEGGFAQPSAAVSTALGVVGGMLGLATAVVVVVN